VSCSRQAGLLRGDDGTAVQTSLARWIGAPVDLDLTALDPPGLNQGVKRFGKTDF
jgi:hypothetical protein